MNVYRHRNQTGWMNIFKEKKALWCWDAGRRTNHAVVRSGFHTDTYFNGPMAISDPNIRREAAEDLFAAAGNLSVNLTVVLGPQTGATELAKALKICAGDHVTAISPAKEGVGAERRVVLTDEDRAKLKGATVLLCEDTITTGDSLELAVQSMVDIEGVAILPTVLCLVNRSTGGVIINGRNVISLIHAPSYLWTPEQCPLCEGGSSPITNVKDHWAELTRYID